LLAHPQQTHSRSLALAVLTAFLSLLAQLRGTAQGQGTTTTQVEPTATSTQHSESSTDQQDSSQTRLKELTVTERRPTTAASSETIRARDYELRPHTTTQQLLNNLPGLLVGQHQGGGKATQYFLRGFDADHGTDVAVFVDGVPVNFVSHAHGQGYADLNFLIPETVQRIELRKGPYFVEYGDLASAGSINIITKDDVVENSFQALGGRYNTMRYATVASPRLGSVKTLLASEVYFNDGPFMNPQNTARYNLFSKLTWEPSPESKLSFWGSYYYGDWDASGQIPLREVHSGRLSRFGAIDPTEGGHSDRQNLNLIYTYTPTPQEQWFAQVYGTRYKLALWSNFTFFLNNTVRGDGIEQNDQRYTYGGRLRYSRIWSLGSMMTQSTIGVETRNDDASVGLFNQQKRHRFETTTKVHVDEHSISGYLLQEFFLTEWARLQVGLRGDEFFFDVGNRLPPTATNATLIRGSTNDGLVNPKANLILSPFQNSESLWRNTEFYLNFGMGYHSNDARDAVQARTSPLSRSTGGEIGVRTNLWDRLDLAAALWILDLNSEIVFVGDDGTTEARGPTRRWGIDFETRYPLLDWLYADFDLAYADPRFRVTGQAIPLAITLLMNGGLTARFSDGLSGAIRFRYIDDRPLNENRTLTARGYYLVDLIFQYRWRNFEASLQLLNLTNNDWRETQFDTNSCVRREVGVDPRCPASGGGEGIEGNNFTPGNPINVQGALTLFF
jgi:outer membrane receptor protein involved in Fe transport